MTELQKSASPVRPRSTHLEPVQLVVVLKRALDAADAATFGLGLSDDGDAKVVDTNVDSEVENLNQIEVGDRIVAINGKPLEVKSREGTVQNDFSFLSWFRRLIIRYELNLCS